MAAITKVTSKSPFLTESPCFTDNSKPLPSNSTVSMPICINNSTPSVVVKPTACPVGNYVVISPSAGAYSLPSVGSIATPFPKISSPKVGSLTLLIATVFPFTGEPISIHFSFFLKKKPASSYFDCKSYCKLADSAAS